MDFLRIFAIEINSENTLERLGGAKTKTNFKEKRKKGRQKRKAREPGPSEKTLKMEFKV